MWPIHTALGPRNANRSQISDFRNRRDAPRKPPVSRARPSQTAWKPIVVGPGSQVAARVAARHFWDFVSPVRPPYSASCYVRLPEAADADSDWEGQSCRDSETPMNAAAVPVSRRILGGKL